MIRGLNHATVRGVGPADAAAAAATAGLDAVALWHMDLPEDDDELDRLRGELAVPVAEIDVLAPFMLTDERDAGLAQLSDAARVAARLGAGIVVTAPAFGTGDLDEAAADLRAGATAVAAHGCVLAIEPICFAEQFSTLAAVLDLVERSDHDAARVCLDTFHAAVAGTAPAEIDGRCAERIAVVHVADAPDLPRERLLEPHRHRVHPGRGVQPVREHLAALAAAGSDAPLMLDIFNDELWSRDAREVARDAAQALDELLEPRSRRTA